MFSKTSSIPFLKFGEIHSDGHGLPENLETFTLPLHGNAVNSVYYSDQDLYIRSNEGFCLLYITEDLDKPMEEFVLHRICQIKAGMYFALLALSEPATVNIGMIPGTKLNTRFLQEQIIRPTIKRKLDVQELICWFYSVRGQNYSYPESAQHCWELTFVDSGELKTAINGEILTLNSNELIFYAPGDTIRQGTGDRTCSYLTVMFDMDIPEADWDKLAHKIFTATPEIRKDMERFVQHPVSAYSDSLLVNALEHSMLTLLSNGGTMSRTMASPMQFTFENEILTDILLYINENINKPLTVEDVCQQFAMSRSSLQALFANHMDTSPKQFISSEKLKKSRILIKENRYTLSEVASMLGYSSIHYFSRKFKAEYGLTPSEYSQKLLD